MFTGQSNQSTAGAVAPPTNNHCEMKTMYKHVVNKLSPHWEILCDYLEYGVAKKKEFKCEGDSKSCLVAVLEDWISTDNGKRPKTWSTFVEVLHEINQLTTNTGDLELSKVTNEVINSLTVSRVPTGKSLLSVCVCSCYDVLCISSFSHAY